MLVSRLQNDGVQTMLDSCWHGSCAGSHTWRYIVVGKALFAAVAVAQDWTLRPLVAGTVVLL